MTAFVHRKVLRMWRTWRERVVDVTEQKRKVLHGYMHIVKAGLGRAMFSWVEAHRERVRQRGLVRHAVMQMSMALYTEAFDRWANLTADVHDQAERMRGAVARMRQAQLAAAFATWLEYEQTATRQQEEVLHALDMMKNRVSSRTLGMAWRAWEAFVRGILAHRTRLEHAVFQMRHRQVAAAWQAWLAHTLHEHGKAGKARIIQQWQHREEAKGFHKWLGVTQAAPAPLPSVP